MSDLTVPASSASANLQVVDSLCANEFAVEVDGQRVSGILRVSGLTSFKLEVKTTTSLKQLFDSFKVVKMVQRDPNLPINRWIRETIAAKADIVRPTRTLTVIALDDGVETRRWTAPNAWISEISYSDFNTGSPELVEETLVIQHDGIEESWPGA